MNRNRVMRGLGLITLVMLAFGLAGCGSEPAPVARPPAPPPAPPPFQPQAVEVALGESGDTVTLMTAEGGGFTLNGEAFAGGEVTAENGNMYLLALADGTWTAAFQEPAGIEVMLGDHGGTVIITMTEDGKYFIGEMEITADTMVMGENGQYYTPGLDEEGMWVAVHVMEAPVSVMLSDHGGTAMLQLAEDNTWWYDGMLFEDGGMVAGDNGQYYTLSMDEEGMWMAMHVMEAPVMVTLGDHGGSRMLQLAEDNTWWYDGMLFEDGDMLMGDNGQSYTLMMDDEGMWMSMHVMEAPVTVALGTSGSVDLQQAEDNSWWIGEMAFASGDTYTANGNEYMLTYDMATGMWASDFQPMSMEIMGTGLMAMSREADDMYDVAGSEDTIPASGMADITVDGAMYHVSMDEDGMLMGARYDAGINGDTDMMVGHLDALPTLSGDDEDTMANEAGTMLTVAGTDFPIADLLASGTADSSGSNFVVKTRAEIEKIRDQSALLVEAFDFDGATRADKQLLERQLDKKWDAADVQIQKIFPGKELTRETDEDDAVDAFDDVLEALSGLDEFAAAVKKDDEGVFDNFLADSGMTAEEVFEATDSEARVLFGAVGDTRFGAVAKKERSNATSKLKHELGDEDGVGSMGAAGAFAYATIDDTVRSHHIQTSGNAYYEGETLAVTGDGTLYMGDIAIEVRFRSEKVSGLVTNLESEDGEPWHYLVGDVHSILLPTATLKSTANWSMDGRGSANYAPRPGSPGAQMGDSTFAGNLLGTGDDAGSQAAGTWSFGKESNQDKGSYISGGFGAERTESVTGPEPETGDGTETETVSIPGMGRKVDEMGTDVEVDGRSVMRLLGASLGDGMLTIMGLMKDGTAVVNGTTEDPLLQTTEVSLADAFDSAGAAIWENHDTQVSLARDRIETLRDRLEGFTRIDEDPTVRNQKEIIWDEIIAVLMGRIFDASAVKRASEGADGVVMEVVDALGTKIYASLTGDNLSGGPQVTDDLSSVTVVDGKIVASQERTYDHDNDVDTAEVTERAPAWTVVVDEPMVDDPAKLTRLSVVGAPEDFTTKYVIHDGDLMTEEVYDDWQTALVSDTGAEPSTVLARDVELMNHLVNGNIAELTLGSMDYPTRNAAGDPDDIEALDAIDDVLAALATEDTFEDALAKGGSLEYLNRSEKADGDPDDASDDAAIAVGDIWGRKEARVQVRLGSTNYTRFGVWRKETNKAANLGYTKLADAADENSGDGPGAFAYSSLPATEYQSAADSTYPGGGSATYTGETVALQGTTHYTGLISVTASWEASWTGLDTTGAPTDAADDVTDYMLGTVTAVISGLETDDGDPLQRYMTSATQTGDNPDTDAMESTSNEYVTTTAMDIREIIFTGVNITTPNDEDDNTLGFRSDFMGTDAGDPRARITTMIGSDPSTLVGGGVDQTGTDATMESAMLVGTFVGQDVDGPLGVIGRWKLMDPDGVMSELESVERTFPDDGSATQVNTNEVTVTDGDLMRIGDGTTLYGAFGAEVEP